MSTWTCSRSTATRSCPPDDSWTGAEVRAWCRLAALLDLPLVTDPLESARHYRVAPLHVVAFSCWPGPGCEPANFGLCRYPKAIEIGGQDHSGDRRIETRLHDWSWASFCKTQYARNREYGGASNFRHCHLTITAENQPAQAAMWLGLCYDVRRRSGTPKSRSPTEGQSR